MKIKSYVEDSVFKRPVDLEDQFCPQISHDVARGSACPTEGRKHRDRRAMTLDGVLKPACTQSC